MCYDYQHVFMKHMLSIPGNEQSQGAADGMVHT